ncbi:MAG TPA: MmgE/PrpD family protein [Solirubrobacteraceae bacterium]
MDEAYRAALLDWMACAVGGRDEPAARAARVGGDGLLETVTALGTAGHVLDFDDTYLPGIAHLSAPVAPAAIAVAARAGATTGDVLAAHAAGFEAMGALARGAHPALYDGGWHPTAVCGSLGAAVAAAHLLGLDAERTRHARGLALLRPAGMRSVFGSDGKSLQVGIAAAAGVQAALLAAGGARSGAQMETTFGEGFTAAALGDADGAQPAIEQNWIKPWPCCLMAHGAIECATLVGGLQSSVSRSDKSTRPIAEPAKKGPPTGPGRLTVAVHPVARAAAAYDDVADGLQAKFSIPYLTAFTLLRGEPRVASFASVDDEIRDYARERIAIRVDDALGESETIIEDAEGSELARVAAARGSPGRPLTADQLAAKVKRLAGAGLDGVLAHDSRPAAELRDAIVA